MKEKSPWKIYTTLLFGCFITVEAASFQTPAMPAIANYFGVKENFAALIALCYYLALVSCSPIFGRIADSFGRKKVLSNGLLLFSISEVIAAMSSTFEILLLARLLQGMAVACIVPILLSYIAYLFPKEKRGMPLGVLAFTMALGGASGAIIGGIMIDHFGWRSIYWISGAAGILGWLLVLRYTPETELSDEPYKLDLPGSLWLLVSIGGIISLPTWISHFGFASMATMGSLAIALVGILMLWQTEKKAMAPIVNMQILGNKAFFLPCLIYMLFLVCHNGSVYTLAFFINNRPDGSASQVGLINTCVFGVGMLASLASGKLVDVLSERTVVIAVSLFSIVGFVCYSTIDIATPFWIIVLIASSLGIAQGLKGPAITKLALSTLPSSRYSSGSGIFSMMRDIGSPAGISVGLALFTSQRINATNSAIEQTALNLGLENEYLPQTYLAIEQGKLDAFPELAERLQQLGINFETFSSMAKIEGLSGALSMVGIILACIMLSTFLIATRLPKSSQPN